MLGTSGLHLFRSPHAFNLLDKEGLDKLSYEDALGFVLSCLWQVCEAVLPVMGVRWGGI